jgi:bifunctional enzyme CysN/CysC
MQNTLVDRILFHPTELCDACAPLSVVLTLRDSLDLGRGTMLAGVRHCPAVTKDFTAKLIWMSKTRLELNRPYLVRHTTQTVCGYVIRLLSKIDITSLEDHPGDTLLFNEIGTVEVETNKAIFCDPYFDNRVTGSFILIDPLSADTLAAGIIVETDPRVSTLDRGFRRAAILTTSNQVIGGLTVWLTGLSGSGKSSIARAVHTELLSQGIRAELLDSDDLRRTLNSDLGFSKRDRDENVRRIGFIATLLARNGIVALVSAISPYRSTREEVRQLTRAFLEVFVDAPLEICEQRDPKGLYKQARAGEIQGFTGIDDPYEKPLQPDVHCFTDKENLRLSTDKVLSAVLKYIDRI